MDFKSNLKKEYTEKYKKELMSELGIENINSVPNLSKIVVNVGAGKAKTDSGLIESLEKDLATITGQKPIVTKAKAAISNFKIREEMPIGLKVTLRGERMWFFLEKLIDIVLPRVKDFRGVPRKAFDGNGNYTLGFKDQLVFPEIDPTKTMKIHGLQVIIGTTAKTDENSFKFLEKLGFPFEKTKK